MEICKTLVLKIQDTTEFLRTELCKNFVSMIKDTRERCPDIERLRILRIGHGTERNGTERSAWRKSDRLPSLWVALYSSNLVLNTQQNLA